MANVRTPPHAGRARGARLRQLRLDQGRTTMQMAIELGMTQKNYESYESGRNAIRAELLRPLGRALSMDPHTVHDVLFPVEESFRYRAAAALVSLVDGGPRMSLADS